MAMLTSREDLKQYCLRRLGAPVIDINVDDTQLEDRIDDALNYFWDNHYDGIEKVYLKMPVKASEIVITTPDATDFKVNDIVVGLTSGAAARVVNEIERQTTGNMILVIDSEIDFVPGETVKCESSGVQKVVATYTKNEWDKKSFYIPNNIAGVVRVVPFSAYGGTRSMFDVQYQLMLNDITTLTTLDISNYYLSMRHLTMLNNILNSEPQFRFNKFNNRLDLDIKFKDRLVCGQYIILEAYSDVNPNDHTRVWDDQWLKSYTTALFKKAWGTNLKKYQGMQLPGGITVDGQSIYDEAVGEQKDLEEDLAKQEAPLDFFLG